MLIRVKTDLYYDVVDEEDANKVVDCLRSDIRDVLVEHASTEMSDVAEVIAVKVVDGQLVTDEEAEREGLLA